MMNRRRFLTRLGLAGVATGLSGLELGKALAATAPQGAPKRLIIISHCHGWPRESWRMTPEGTSDSGVWEAELTSLPIDAFSQALAPLYSHRGRMLALDGLSLASAELDVDGNRHDTGWVHAWTGNNATFGGTHTRSQSASLDQIVAAQIARSDRLPSLELSVNAGLEQGRPIAYSPSGMALPIEADAARVWQRLFGPMLSPDPLAPKQRGVLDFAYQEYAALAPKLGAQQREKLDAHFDLLSRLGDRLDGMASLACDIIPEPPAEPVNYDARFDAFAELIGAAFACDITRVVTLGLGEMPTEHFGWDHMTDDVHKGLAHGIYDSANKYAAMSDYLTMHAQQVARLVTLLESLPDVDGQSVMDNTLIVWGSELADGWHGYRHYCPVILGGSWHFKTGRYMHWPHETPIQILVPPSVAPSGYSMASGMPHQHLLVSVAQAMQLSTDHVGLHHVQGQTGEFVTTTGPLPGLT